jgi:hypothetical protein
VSQSHWASSFVPWSCTHDLERLPQGMRLLKSYAHLLFLLPIVIVFRVQGSRGPCRCAAQRPSRYSQVGAGIVLSSLCDIFILTKNNMLGSPKFTAPKHMTTPHRSKNPSPNSPPRLATASPTLPPQISRAQTCPHRKLPFLPRHSTRRFLTLSGAQPRTRRRRSRVPLLRAQTRS